MCPSWPCSPPIIAQKNPCFFELMKPWSECTCKHRNKNWSRFPEVHSISWWSHKNLGTTLVVTQGNLAWKHGHGAVHSRIQTIADPGVQFLLYSQLVPNVFLWVDSIFGRIWEALCVTPYYFSHYSQCIAMQELYFMWKWTLLPEHNQDFFFFLIFNLFWISSL